jgi:hypothetical protein
MPPERESAPIERSPSRRTSCKCRAASTPWRLPVLYLVCLTGIAARVFSLQPALAIAGIAVFLSGWPLYQLGRKALPGAGL